MGELDGRTALLTGSTGGLGSALASALLDAGVRLICPVRRPEAAWELHRDWLRTRPEASVTVLAVDLADPASIEAVLDRVADGIGGIDLLINNAAVIAQERRTVGGIELQWAVNHLAGMRLALGILRRQDVPYRLVQVSSWGHRRGRVDLDDVGRALPYDPRQVYEDCKLANILLVDALRARYPQISACAVSPGLVATRLLADYHRSADQSPPPGRSAALPAAEIRALCAAPAEDIDGRYFESGEAVHTPSLEAALPLSAALWERCVELLAMRQVG